MNTNQETLTLHEGMDVFGTDGEKLGSVDHIEGDYIVAKKGWLFPTDYYLPSSAVASVDEDRLILSVTKDEVMNQGWDIAPTDREGARTTNAGAAPLTGNGAFADSTRSKGIGADPLTETGVAADTKRAKGVAADPLKNTGKNKTGQTETDDTIRVPLSKEELTATTRQVERGQVRIDKEVVAEEQGLDVPVTEERINVSRRAVDRPLGEGETLLEDDSIVVRVRGEEVDLQKRTRVTEELEVSKEPVLETRHVSDTVRHERARVSDTSGGVEASELDRNKK